MKEPLSEIPLDDLSDDIAELSAHIDAASCRLMEMVIEFDRRCGWGVEGAKSCVHWLGWRLGWSSNTASERLRVGYALEQLPELHEAFAAGQVSYSKMRAVTRVATPETATEWLNIALNSTAAQCERIVSGTRRALESEDLVTENARHEHRDFRTHWDANGMFVMEGRLPPELGAVVEKALEAEVEALRGEQTAQADEEEPSIRFTQQKADGLVRMAEKALRGESSGRTAERYQVVVHVDAEVLANAKSPGRCQVDNGPSLSAESLRRLTCDCSQVTMLHDHDGNILDVGRKTRTISAGMRRALDARDEGCRFPGCDCQRTDGHHIEHWIDNGETKLTNLVLMCRRHHRLVHEGGFSVALDRSGEPVFLRPNGSVIPNNATLPALRGDPTAEILHLNKQAGHAITAETNLSGWDGERPQYAYIIEGMAHLAQSRRSAVALTTPDCPAPRSD